jgi:hypothetical protein
LYEGVSEQALLFRVVRGDPPPLERLAAVFPPLAEAIRRTVTFAVEERMQRAADLRAALVPLRQSDRGRSALARVVAEASEWQGDRDLASSSDTRSVRRQPPA